MAKDVKHFLRFLSAILDSSLESSLFRYVFHFFIGLFVLLMSSFLSSLYVLEISPLSDMGLVKIFSHSVGSYFVFLTMSFAVQKHFNYINSAYLRIGRSFHFLASS